MIGGGLVVVGQQGRRRICQQVGAENLAAGNVRERQTVWYDVIVTFAQAVGVLNRKSQFAARERIAGGGQLQPRRGVDQALNALRVARGRIIDVLIHVAAQHIRMEAAVRGEENSDEIVGNRAGLRAARSEERRVGQAG